MSETHGLTRYRQCFQCRRICHQDEAHCIECYATTSCAKPRVYLASEVDLLLASKDAQIAALTQERDVAVRAATHIQNDRDRAEAEVETLRHARDWQPIATAPKTHMFRADLYVPGSGRLTSCTYSTLFDPPQWCFRLNYGDDGIMKVVPTHWMPLPAPPEPER